MQLWSLWWSMVAPLAGACSYRQSFLWLATALAGLCVRPDLLGVSSLVRALGLAAHCYERLLGHFHSAAVDVDALSRLWTRQVLRHLCPHRLNGRLVLLGDGLKVAKSGRQMPAVKRLHQVSENNTKPESILGHSIQAISLLTVAAGSFMAVPLTARIHEGVKFTNRDQRTVPQKFCTLIDSLGLTESFVLIADAYYACTAVGTWALAGVARSSRVCVVMLSPMSRLHPLQDPGDAAGPVCMARKSSCVRCSIPPRTGKAPQVPSTEKRMSPFAFDVLI